MNRLTLLDEIQAQINKFSNGVFEENALHLFNILGYRSDRRIANLNLTAENIAQTFNSPHQLNGDKALVKDWLSVNLLFQLTDDEIHVTPQLHMVFDSQRKVDPSIYRSYLFMGLELAQNQYTRTQLAEVTREVNYLFAIPVLILFKHGASLTLAVIHRRPNRRENEKDVLEKVTLIKDIRIQNSNRAHLEILADLSLDQLSERHSFTNFLELYKAWQDTLSISDLNKRFYSELANWYFWAVDKVHFPFGADNNEKKRNAISVIRLITRLIFIWFIKEKGLIKEDLFDKRKLEKIVRLGKDEETIYYKAVLQNLFFATLNTEMNQDIPGTRKFVKDYPGKETSYIDPYEYRYKDLFYDPDQFFSMCQEIPFLNGGLFECLDREVTQDEYDNDPSLKNRTVYEGNQIVLRVDGFSQLNGNPLCVPDYLFFADEHYEDLNLAYGTKNKRYKVRGVIKLLSHYKFTIEENTPIEEEVALDPELLGKVFENLLAAYNPETEMTARKQTGSFYTPREIVDYMVNEALLAYFEGKIAVNEDLKTRLSLLLGFSVRPIQFSDNEINLIIHAISEIKVLDPACGSGAFPMGVLHKLVYLLQRLDNNNTRWPELQRQIALQETEEAYQIGNRKTRQDRLLEIEESFTNNTDDYGRKLYIIEKSIYGVDIQPIAVQIAKLRFFISLVVEQKIEDSRPNRGIRPLPNLETKFVAANSLIELERPRETEVNSKMSYAIPEEIHEEINLLVEKFRQYLSIRNPNLREKYLDESRLLATKINLAMNSTQGWTPIQIEWIFQTSTNVDILKSVLPIEQPKQALTIPLRSSEVQDLEDKLVSVRRKNFRANRKEKHLLRTEDEILRRKLLILLKKQKGWSDTSAIQLISWNPYDQNSSADFFDSEWMFGIPEGFNLVISNPPYVNIENIPYDFRQYLLNRYGENGKLGKRYDIYQIFILKGIKLLIEKGVLSYILPNTFLMGHSYELLRKRLANQTRILECVDLPQGVFESAVVDNVLLLIQRETNLEIKRNNKIIINKLYSKSKLNRLTLNNWDESFEIMQSEIIESEEFKINIQTNDIQKEMFKLMTTNAVNLGEITESSQGIILYKTAEDSIESKYTSFTSQPGWKKLLRGKNIGQYFINWTGEYVKYGPWLWSSREEKFFVEPKILLQAIRNKSLSRRLICAFDEDQYYNAHNLANIIARKDSTLELKYILGLINSKLLNYWYKAHFPNVNINPNDFRKLPIYKGSLKEQKIIINIVDLILKLYKEKEIISWVSNKLVASELVILIDGLVYELYFSDVFHGKDLTIFPILSNKIQLISLDGIIEFYSLLSDPNSEIRARLVRQNIEVEEVRIINEALKK